MRVQVTDCWCGADKYKWRLQFNAGDQVVRECIYHDPGEGWSRRTAATAKDLISENWGVRRSSIRFDL